MSDADSEVEINELGWRKRVANMRERLKNRFDENTVAGNREEKLNHGMKMVASIMMIGKLSEICYCDETQEYLVIDPPSSMLRYSVQGKLIQPSYNLSPAMLFTKLLWCNKAKVLIGYVPNDDSIWLMTSFCTLYQIVRNEFRINAIFYEPLTNEAVVTGPNKVTRYPLANKEAVINPWKTMSYIDSEYGALWKLECTSLIPASTSMMRMAGSYITTLYILSLETLKEKEDGVPVMFLARNTAATDAAITALLFQYSSLWIITGDEQGNVKGWDLDLNCTINCPGIHRGSVNQIALHPSICGFVTRAEDNILQIWSCNFRGKIESFSGFGEIRGIAVNESAAAIATLGQKLCCFSMHQLYTFYAALSERAVQIISTANPMRSTQVIVRSDDNTIRVLASSSGKQTNIQILLKSLSPVSMAYSGIKDRLYTIILKTGEVLVSNCRTNPMEFKHVWVADGTVITCITAYECYEEIRGPDLKPQNPRVIYPKRVLIFVGTEDGAVVNVDESSGKHEARFPAHNGPVTRLCSSTASRLVVSAGVDKCVRVWQVYADLGVPLALANSIYYTVSITHVVTMGSIICVVSSTPEPSATLHQLFMYDAKETVRLDHHPSKDHKELITDIAASETLQICATSSIDNTIRIWDHQNLPIKILEINTCANTVAFSSLRGDIVFGAGRHLYKISYQNYLAPKYRARILLNEIPEETEEDEDTLPGNIDYKIYDDIVDRDVILHPVSSVPLGSLDMSGEDAPRLELMVQQQTCAQLERRDEDIENITKGEIKAVKFIAEKSLMNHEVWEKYLEDMIGTGNKIEIPSYDIWAMVEQNKGVKRFYNKPGVFKMIYGYSIEKFPEYPEVIPDIVRKPGIPLFGFLPNSLIYKIFSEEDEEPPPPEPEPKPPIKYIYPPEFLGKDLRESSSARFASNVEISPSQLLNMTRIVDSDTEINVARIAITENENPFLKIARRSSIRTKFWDGKNKEETRRRVSLKERKKEKIEDALGWSVGQRNGRKIKLLVSGFEVLERMVNNRFDLAADFGIPLNKEKMDHNKVEGKFRTILSQKVSSSEAETDNCKNKIRNVEMGTKK